MADTRNRLMRAAERDLDRILNHLRNRMRERGYTQREVQEVLGWGRSYISQLVTRQKSLRVDHVLVILNVIGVRPEEFWAELFQFGAFSETRPRGRGGRRRRAAPTPQDARTCSLICVGPEDCLRASLPRSRESSSSPTMTSSRPPGDSDRRDRDDGVAYRDAAIPAKARRSSPARDD